MFKSRLMNIIFILMGVVIVAVIVFFVLMQQKEDETKPIKNPTLSQIVNDLTFSTGEITTNIRDDHFIKVNFKIQVSTEAAKAELAQRSFQVKNAVIYAVSGLRMEDVQGQDGIVKLENDILQRINRFLKSGQVTHVYTTEIVAQ
ncbi:MAG: flagellar basal body-associated FliL family protein [Sporolactobacillus sp.]